MIQTLIAAGIVICAAAIAWINNSKTEEEEKKQKEIKRDIDAIKSEIGGLDKEYEKRRDELYEEKFLAIRGKLLREARRCRREKEGIREDLQKIKKEIEQVLRRPDLSPYLQNGLKKEFILVEDAENRLNAYFRYIAWYEGNIEVLFNKRAFESLKQTDIPNSLLPDDWLYVGKLLLLDNKQELNTKNRYGQKLGLSGVYESETKSFNFEIEEKALNKYETDVPILIVHENKVVIDRRSNERVEIENPVVFKGSVLKGELYVNHLLMDLPFEAKPRHEKIEKDENFYYYKDVIKCKMKKRDKKFPLKRYLDDDEIIVYAIEHDLLLNKIWVSERPQQKDNLSSSPVYITYSNTEDAEAIDKALIDSQYKFNVSFFNPLEYKIVLRAGDLSLKCSIKEQFLSVDEIKTEMVTDSISIELPFDFEIVPEDFIKDNIHLLYDAKNSLLQLLDIVGREIEYVKQTTDTSRDDYDFFRKWLSIVEYLIEQEEIRYEKLKYSEIIIKKGGDNSQYPNQLEIKFSHKPKDVKDLLVINEKVLSFADDKVRKNKNNFEVALMLRTSQNEKFYLCPIGYLYDDIDVEKKSAQVVLDSPLSDLTEFDPNKEFYIGFYNNPSALYRQKKALINFQRGELVKPELKRILISPRLIRRAVNPYEDEAFDRSIQWKNPDLTDNQKEIVKSALLEQNLFVIQGPPGTGKTTVIKEIVYQYLKDNPKRRCLIVSQQNTAVDNALIRIYQENKDNWFNACLKSIVRVAVDTGKVSEDLQEFTIDNWFNDYKKRLIETYQIVLSQDTRLQKLMQDWYRLVNKESISAVDREVADVLLSSHQIVGATCVGFANKRLGIDRTEFDIVIIDEAARATLPELLIPILRAKKVILIGDQSQLPPTVSNTLRDDNEALDKIPLYFLEKSFFERLFDETPDTNKSVLLEQFRMPKEVGNMISTLFYNGILKNGIVKTAEGFISPKTIQWIDVKGRNQRELTSRYNIEEARAVKRLILDIANKVPTGVKKDIAVITPYTAQKKIINKIIKDSKHHKEISRLNVKCNTVDSFQGQESDIVIYCCVRTDGNLSFLLDKKRLNVALSRVKENLFIVGHKDFLYNAEFEGKENLFRTIIDYIDGLYA